MNIGTEVFQRINDETRRGAIKAIADVMEQTVRFGTFNREYVEKCAAEFFDETLAKVRRRTTRFKQKTRVNPFPCKRHPAANFYKTFNPPTYECETCFKQYEEGIER